VPQRSRKGKPSPLILSDEELADVLREFLPEDWANLPLCLSPTALFDAARKLLVFAGTLADKRKLLSRATQEVLRITETARELRSSMLQADPHTLRLLLADDSTEGRRQAMFMALPLEKIPWLGALEDLEHAGVRTAEFLKSESTGGPGTLLTHLIGKRNYHFALQSRVILAALGSPNESRSSSRVCRMAAALISIVDKAVTDAGLRQYAEDSFDTIQSHPEEFREAHLRLLEKDLAARCSKDDPVLSQVRAQLRMGPSNASRALIESTGI